MPGLQEFSLRKSKGGPQEGQTAGGAGKRLPNTAALRNTRLGDLFDFSGTGQLQPNYTMKLFGIDSMSSSLTLVAPAAPFRQ